VLTQNSSEQYDVTNGVYNPRSPYDTGIFSISTVLIKTSFLSDENSSAAFSDFRFKPLMTVAIMVDKGMEIALSNQVSTQNNTIYDGISYWLCKIIRPFYCLRF
jgi:cell surface protein SprA